MRALASSSALGLQPGWNGFWLCMFCSKRKPPYLLNKLQVETFTCRRVAGSVRLRTGTLARKYRKLPVLDGRRSALASCGLVPVTLEYWYSVPGCGIRLGLMLQQPMKGLISDHRRAVGCRTESITSASWGALLLRGSRHGATQRIGCWMSPLYNFR